LPPVTRNICSAEWLQQVGRGFTTPSKIQNLVNFVLHNCTKSDNSFGGCEIRLKTEAGQATKESTCFEGEGNLISKSLVRFRGKYSLIVNLA
jgi:hypothetical protein